MTQVNDRFDKVTSQRSKLDPIPVSSNFSILPALKCQFKRWQSSRRSISALFYPFHFSSPLWPRKKFSLFTVGKFSGSRRWELSTISMYEPSFLRFNFHPLTIAERQGASSIGGGASLSLSLPLYFPTFRPPIVSIPSRFFLPLFLFSSPVLSLSLSLFFYGSIRSSQIERTGFSKLTAATDSNLPLAFVRSVASLSTSLRILWKKIRRAAQFQIKLRLSPADSREEFRPELYFSRSVHCRVVRLPPFFLVSRNPAKLNHKGGRRMLSLLPIIFQLSTPLCRSRSEKGLAKVPPRHLTLPLFRFKGIRANKREEARLLFWKFIARRIRGEARLDTSVSQEFHDATDYTNYSHSAQQTGRRMPDARPFPSFRT